MVLLPETDAEGAATTAERLCADLAGTSIETTAGPVTVTISIGVAAHVPRRPHPDEAAEDDVTAQAQTLLQRADRALYEAKAGGRSCVRVADGDSSAPAGTTASAGG